MLQSDLSSSRTHLRTNPIFLYFTDPSIERPSIDPTTITKPPQTPPTNLIHRTQPTSHTNSPVTIPPLYHDSTIISPIQSYSTRRFTHIPTINTKKTTKLPFRFPPTPLYHTVLHTRTSSPHSSRKNPTHQHSTFVQTLHIHCTIQFPRPPSTRPPVVLLAP